MKNKYLVICLSDLVSFEPRKTLAKLKALQKRYTPPSSCIYKLFSCCAPSLPNLDRLFPQNYSNTADFLISLGNQVFPGLVQDSFKPTEDDQRDVMRNLQTLLTFQGQSPGSRPTEQGYFLSLLELAWGNAVIDLNRTLFNILLSLTNESQEKKHFVTIVNDLDPIRAYRFINLLKTHYPQKQWIHEIEEDGSCFLLGSAVQFKLQNPAQKRDSSNQSSTLLESVIQELSRIDNHDDVTVIGQHRLSRESAKLENVNITSPADFIAQHEKIVQSPKKASYTALYQA